MLTDLRLNETTTIAYTVAEKDITDEDLEILIIDLIEKECDAIKKLLLEKNRKYGNSALSPLRIFSKADRIEQLNVRCDDKLSRIKNAQNDEDEDPEKDLIGYIILKRVAKKLK